MRYRLAHYYGATVYEMVEADSPEEALEKTKILTPTLCHQCSDEVEMDECISTDVLTEDYSLVKLGLSRKDQEIERLKKEIEYLLTRLQTA